LDGEILHDYFAVWEGGGRLALTLGSRWGWPVTTGFVSDRIPLRREWPGVALHGLGVRPGFRPRQSMSLARRWARYRSPAGTVVYSGTYAPMAAVNQPDARNILYCHTPPRFMYDDRATYLASMPSWQRPAFRALLRYLKPRYESSIEHMDSVIANSENVRRRVAQWLGRAATVVYPPCDVQQYHWCEPEGYYLSTARLDVLKRVELVVEAFKRMPDRKLVVASDGPERPGLEALAGNAANIAFTGAVDDEYMRSLIGRCIATVYVPRNEDFGMSPVESMAAGKPVIGVAEGGLLETIVDGETGILMPGPPTVDNVVESVRGMTPGRARRMRDACEARAWSFRTDVFLERMSEVVNGD